MIKILHSGDLHVDFNATILGSQNIVNGVNQYHVNRIKRIENMITDSIKEGINIIIIGGDVHNKKHPPAQEYADLYTILDAIPNDIQVYIIPGNHDESTSIGSPLLPLYNRRKNIHVIFEVTSIPINNITFTFAPWGTPVEQLKIMDTSVSNFLVYHVGVTGTKGMNWGEMIDEPGTIHIDQLKNLNYNGILLSHHHDQVELYTHIWYAGSPECFNFGEAEQKKGYLIWEIEKNGNCKVIQKHTSFPKFKIINYQDFLQTEDLENLSNYYIRIDGEITSQERLNVFKKMKTCNCLGVKYNLKMRTDKHKSLHIPGKTHGEILLNFLQRNNKFNLQQLQRFKEIDREITNNL